MDMRNLSGGALSDEQVLLMDYLKREEDHLRQLKDQVDKAFWIHVERARPAIAASQHFLWKGGLDEPD